MKVVVDAMCAEFGGIRTYVEHLLAAWREEFPADELHVIVPEGFLLPTAGHVRHELKVRRPRLLGRPAAQTRAIGRIVRRVGADVVLATAPTTTVIRPRVPLAVVILDLRHEIRPEQFSAKTKLLRAVSYGRTYRLASHFLAISQRSLDDLHRLHPGLSGVPATVTYLGADHVRTWPSPTQAGPAVAFAHHTNKNPMLVLDGWAALRDRGGNVPPLMILGVGAQRHRLEAEIAARSLADVVELAPFLPDEEFQRVLSAARMVVFPSDFEGFGLPVVEGMFLGHPVVIGPEPATTEIAGGHAFVTADWGSEALADAIAAASDQSEDARLAAMRHGCSYTWTRTARQTRDALVTLVR